jgi:hypothetical protein
LSSFLAEAGLPADTGQTTPGNSLSIERLLEEKKLFDLSANFEKAGIDEASFGWSNPGR